MTCSRCGKNVPIRSKVCPNCGLNNPNWQPRPEDNYDHSTQNSQYTNNSQQPQNNTPPNSQKSTQSQHYTTPNAQKTAQTQQTAQKPSASNNSGTKSKSSWKTILGLVVVAVLIIFLVQQCSGKQLQGRWTVQGGGYSFNFTDDKNGYIEQDGNVIVSSERIRNFTYYIDGDELEIKTETTLFSNSDVIRFEFDISGNKLTLTEIESGETEIFYKD